MHKAHDDHYDQKSEMIIKREIRNILLTAPLQAQTLMRSSPPARAGVIDTKPS